MRAVRAAWLLCLPIAGLVLALSLGVAAAAPSPAPVEQGSPIHPAFPLLDGDGNNVLQSGKPASTMATCGDCHDVEFIEEHSYHASVGLDDLGQPGETPTGRPWDLSPGLYGKWDPLSYRYLTPAGASPFDLGTASWVRTLGQQHVGGGPAAVDEAGTALPQVPVEGRDPTTHILDPETGEIAPWDWEASGVVEMNCFLCHIAEPNNGARVAALETGEFRWANTATLKGTGLVSQEDGGYAWNASAFDGNGNVDQDSLPLQDPDTENCGICHGLTDEAVETPLSFESCYGAGRRTATTGQVFSPQRISNSGLNLEGKEGLTRSWDIHTERLVKCTDCHYSLNNPVYGVENEAQEPGHLIFDPRRLELGEYLYQPIHDFARGDSAQGIVAPAFRGTMRGCESCHDVDAGHEWLPYRARHTDALSCESCHIPRLYGGGIQQIDWTVYDDGPRAACRLLGGEVDPTRELLTGYEPVLLPRTTSDGATELAPYNLISIWYWVHGDPPIPVRERDLKSAYLDGAGYADSIVTAFDDDGDGALDGRELTIRTDEQQEVIARRLEALGLEAPRIVGEIQPYSINHSITSDEWATRECETCHAKDSRLTRPFRLASYLPGGVEPAFTQGTNVRLDGEAYLNESGHLILAPNEGSKGLYIFGHDAVAWVDRAGAFFFTLVLLGVTAHGGLRVLRPGREGTRHSTKRVYMYGLYERLWHWMQTFTISALLLTGLIIHRPDLLGFPSFRSVVIVHNVLAGILVANAFLALFYHLASGEIRQFLPRPAGFFHQAIAQARYYLAGIFRGVPHPFEKRPERKLNPLQQITYFGILNVLLPLQVLTGILMWGNQRWPELTARLGGIPLLAPLHTLVAWLFAAFIIAHVYLTTTAGPAPLTAFQAMVLGWDEIEVDPDAEEDRT